MIIMSIKRERVTITLPGYVNDFLGQVMDEMGFNKSELVEECILYVSMPENFKDFKNQYNLVDDDDDDDEEEEEDEDDDDDDEEEEEE